MNRSEEERLADIVMGDAVLQLLQNKGPVSNSSLLDKLRLMASIEPDASRQKALRRAMAEVMNNMQSSRQESVALKDTNNVTHIFRHRDNTGKDTQH
ncbi:MULTISPECIES: hypothetical protein [unclassified Pantoea]|jgi:hypothetical protein|uniref:hypothetical protein n=1 Tax=unclassified Pantoea TaxID=2630326 RepID=UPI001CD6A5F7|nr:MULTISPECIES: hypothetical protein [unclassified Pantoea]MCA1177756.1 hypothetical protein [Pantoea sp. alder69]MCA1252773.1 hypothetical protein [Pantoea sp. alder70]MCA1266480.1 hypothetical protein [Pantoea sp. alder81]